MLLHRPLPPISCALWLQVDPDVRAARRDEMIALQQRVGERWARSMVGRTLDVLVDGREDDGDGGEMAVVNGDVDRGPEDEGPATAAVQAPALRGWIGRTQWDAPDIDHIVLLSEGGDGVAPLAAGQMRRVLITDTVTFDLVGHPVE
jgi:ribosomal protein S12 methylthiotransferase